MLSSVVLSPRPALLAAAVAALFSVQAQAAVALDTFGPGDTADGLGWSLANTIDVMQDLAVPFSLVDAVFVTDILTSIAGSGTYSLGIVAGPALPTGPFLHSATLTNPAANSGLSGVSWSLAEGDYWLVAKAAPGSIGTWVGGKQAASSSWAFASSGQWALFSPDDAPATRITVSAIPEPATWALMLGGLALCAAAARRQRG
jgi:hypothetical protein